MCASQANVKSRNGKEKWDVLLRRMVRVMEEVQEGGKEGATRSEMGKLPHPVDLVNRHAHEIVRHGSWKGLGSGVG